jgi:hypothetical protein
LNISDIKKLFIDYPNLDNCAYILFVGLLALPIYLEHLSGKTGKTLVDENQGRGSKNALYLNLKDGRFK